MPDIGGPAWLRCALGCSRRMNFRRELKINWWLWMTLSIPPALYSWLKPHDVKGWTISDWGYLTQYLRQTGYTVTHDFWNFFVETLLWNILPALLLGWVAQYLIILVWEAWRTKPHRAST